jgi:hypothetical protein
MSFANAVPSKHHVSQLQAGREPFASKDKLPSNAGGLEDFLNELNQATNLRLQVQEDVASENRLKNKKTPESKDLKSESDQQILQNQDANTQNPANIADLAERSDPAIAKMMVALEQISQGNQAKAVSLLNNWGDSALDKSGLDQQTLGVQGTQGINLDLEMFRANLKDLGLENMLGELENAKAAQLAQKLLPQLANQDLEMLRANLKNLGLENVGGELENAKAAQLLNQEGQASIDAKTMLTLQKQLLAEQQFSRLAPDSLKVISVEPSLAQELKMKQAAQFDAEFTLVHNTLMGSNTLMVAPNQAASAVAENLDLGGDTSNLFTSLLMDGQGALKIDQKLNKSLGDDFNGHLLSASQVAQAQSGTSVATPTHIAMSLQEASITSGPLHSEIMSAAKSGGGRIQLELTPPEQGTIRIDLRIDHAGRAHLIVEGANDAAKARLDQGGQQLKNEFAEMGLNLSLDLRQGDSRFGQNQQFGSDQSRFSQPSFSTDRSAMGIGLLSENPASTRLFGDNASGVSGINLYA